jgi:hypothetical protein
MSALGAGYGRIVNIASNAAIGTALPGTTESYDPAAMARMRHVMPALFTRMLTGPSSASVRATIRATASVSVTSAWIAMTRRPVAAISAAAASASATCVA